MKKKLLALTMACALSAACVFAATACNSVGGNNGDNGDEGNSGTSAPVAEVTEAQWKEAFDTVLAAENYTAAIKATYQLGTNQETLFKLTSDTICGENKTENSVHEYAYFLKGEAMDYQLIGNSTDGWQSEAQIGLFDSEKEGLVFYFTNKFSKTNTDTAGAELKDLYSEFTYANGEYKATLLSTAQFSLTFEITLKFADGKITYYYLDGTTANDGVTVRNTMTFELSDYGTTTVTVPADVRQALDDLKSGNNTPAQ